MSSTATTDFPAPPKPENGTLPARLRWYKKAPTPRCDGSRGGRPVSHGGAELYKERNAVERLISRLKDWRGIATRFDKTPEGYLAGLELRASMIWLEDLVQAAD